MKYSKSLMVSGLFTGILVAGGLVGCGGDSPEAKAPEVPAEAPAPPPLEPGPAEGAGEAAGASTVPAEPAPPPAPEPLTDEQIAAVANAVNTGEVDQGKLAQKKAKSAKVKKLAAMLVTQHTAAKGKHTKLFTKAKLTPAESPASTGLTEDSTKLVETLKTAEGADFDKAFVDAQVDGHKKVLDALDTQLLPNAKNADLKAALEEFRTSIETHLKAAQELQAELAAAPAEPAAAKGGAGAKPAKGGGEAPVAAGGATKSAGADATKGATAAAPKTPATPKPAPAGAK